MNINKEDFIRLLKECLEKGDITFKVRTYEEYDDYGDSYWTSELDIYIDGKLIEQ